MTVPVTYIPHLRPEHCTRSFELAPTMSIEEIVAQVLPGLPRADRARVRVLLCYRDQVSAIPPHMWSRVWPHPGVHVLIRVVPGDPVSTIFQLALAVTNSIGWAIAGPGGLSSFWTTAVFAGSVAAIGGIGMAALSALTPSFDLPGAGKKRKEQHEISGWRNEMRPDEVIPDLRGSIRYAPIFAARPYAEVQAGDQYVRALFTAGYGPVKFEDIRIGDTPIEEFEDVEIEIREGRDTDADITLYPYQVYEEAIGAELTRPYPVDAAGDRIKGEPSIETPVIKRSAKNADALAIILSFPEGLAQVNDDGDVIRLKLDLRLRARPAGSSDPWTDITEFNFNQKLDPGSLFQFRWTPAAAGQWDIELTRLSNEHLKDDQRSKCVLAALQTFRYRKPLNFDQPLSLIAVRMRASKQLAGTLDSLNAQITRYAPDWDGATWAEDLPDNPASHFVGVLQAAGNAWPVGAGGIDWDAVQDWHAYCVTNGLTYNRIHEQGDSLGEVLAAICAAGRASPRMNGALWSVVIDRAQDPVAHIGPRNSRAFQGARSYIEPPDAIRVRFSDATNDYQQGEMLVPWIDLPDGAPIDLTEERSLPGKTDPAEIELEIIRMMHEANLRRDRWTVIQDGLLRTVTRGDTVLLSHFVLDERQIAARVSRVDGDLIVLDEQVTIEGSSRYGLSFQLDTEDTTEAVVVEVTGQTGDTRLLRVIVGQDRPEPGQLVWFGGLGEETERARVVQIDPAEDMAFQITLVNDAPELDALAAAHAVTDWSPAIGVPSASISLPGVPEFAGIGISEQFDLLVSARVTGSAAAYVGEIIVEHRQSGASTWEEAAIPGAEGTVALAYDDGDVIELRLTAYNLDGLPGATSAALEYTVDYAAPVAPAALDEASISVIGGLGHTAITLTATDVNTTHVTICRVPDGETFDATTHAIATIAVTPGIAVSLADGDPTRVNLLGDPGFDTGAGWTAGGGWAITGGQAIHTIGSSSDLTQAVSLIEGDDYRIFAELGSATAGTVTPSLTGGTPVTGTAISANGTTSVEVTAATGNDTLVLTASSDFDGALDAVGAFLLTAACAPAGAFDYHFIPLNGATVGPSSSAFATTIK
ncbi:TipJ family phage tail tip protein [Tropicibacter alexandrii]|uniref:TipJ family phage tail tip protein n=1 Tax=Tropicibacter alexandrii TaxID=2267683 RepID=UPI001008988B|nr:phage tail protein [Tropicibacter alexandrii]